MYSYELKSRTNWHLTKLAKGRDIYGETRCGILHYGTGEVWNYKRIKFRIPKRMRYGILKTLWICLFFSKYFENFSLTSSTYEFNIKNDDQDDFEVFQRKQKCHTNYASFYNFLLC